MIYLALGAFFGAFFGALAVLFVIYGFLRRFLDQIEAMEDEA